MSDPPQADNTESHLESDIDSALELSSDDESTASLSTEVKKVTEENKRTYHAYCEGKHMLPNDETEQDRLDLQHHLLRLTFDGELFTCPVGKKEIHRVLDIGTGTGIWAMDFGDKHPESLVVGVDLSPIQPKFVPPNVNFQIDDIEKDWTFHHPFTFIHCRNMIFAISDWENLVKQSFKNLEAGGYLEVIDIAFPVASDDGSIHNTCIQDWSSKILDASRKAKKSLDGAKFHRDRLLKAGFENVQEVIHKWPQNTWPMNEKAKELGRWNSFNFGSNIEGISMALFTRHLGWTMNEVQGFSAFVKRDFQNLDIHAYWNIHVVHGRKPVGQQV